MLQGIAVSPGIGLGRVMLMSAGEFISSEETPGRSLDPHKERERLRLAVEQFCLDTAAGVEMLRKSTGEDDAKILEVHMHMARDPVLIEDTEALIDQGESAPRALFQVCKSYIETFLTSHDELTRMRAGDIEDVCRELMRIMRGDKALDLRGAPKGTILVGRDLSPSIMAGVDREKIEGIITENGGRTSHSSILARALGVPAVCGVTGAMELLSAEEFVIVDGERGQVICSPSESAAADYIRRREEFQFERRRAERFLNQKTVSKSGGEYSIYCDITMPGGAAAVLSAGGEGIGLFRTEYLFMNREAPPGEEEQLLAYSQVAGGVKGRPAVIRILDVGGDKEIPSLGHKLEDNAYMGHRGVRWCLDHESLLMSQLRALLRAGADSPLKILVPMVSTVDEVRALRRLVAKAAKELDKQGLARANRLPLGVMIETPAAAAIADLLAAEADFFSIGSNDLTGYIMACDRGNAKVAALFSALQPAVLRAMRHVIALGKEAGIPVCICGEAAADKRLIPLFMAFGADAVSVSLGAVAAVRSQFALWSEEEAQELADRVMALRTLEEVERAVDRELSGKES